MKIPNAPEEGVDPVFVAEQIVGVVLLQIGHNDGEVNEMIMASNVLPLEKEFSGVLEGPIFDQMLEMTIEYNYPTQLFIMTTNWNVKHSDPDELYHGLVIHPNRVACLQALLAGGIVPSMRIVDMAGEFGNHCYQGLLICAQPGFEATEKWMLENTGWETEAIDAFLQQIVRRNNARIIAEHWQNHIVDVSKSIGRVPVKPGFMLDEEDIRELREGIPEEEEEEEDEAEAEERHYKSLQDHLPAT